MHASVSSLRLVLTLIEQTQTCKRHSCVLHSFSVNHANSMCKCGAVSVADSDTPIQLVHPSDQSLLFQLNSSVIEVRISLVQHSANMSPASVSLAHEDSSETQGSTFSSLEKSNQQMDNSRMKTTWSFFRFFHPTIK